MSVSPAARPDSHAAYYKAFAALTVLTIAEIGVIYVPGIGRGSLIAALILLAVAKAGLVLMVFMHLGRELLGLKLGVLLPFLLPALFAATLIAEALWRRPT
jgi:caa(3)-type oxidase subunit IV